MQFVRYKGYCWRKKDKVSNTYESQEEEGSDERNT